MNVLPLRSSCSLWLQLIFMYIFQWDEVKPMGALFFVGFLGCIVYSYIVFIFSGHPLVTFYGYNFTGCNLPPPPPHPKK